MGRLLTIVLMVLLAPAAAAKTRQAHLPIPDGYELQTLDPVEGEVAKPKGWLYQGGCSEQRCLWKITKDSSHRTGLTIQMFWGLDATGVGKMNLINNFLADKRQNAQVLSECAPRTEGDLTVVCMETREQIDSGQGPEPFRIRYSLQAASSWDMVAVTIFGAPDSEWASARPIADVMEKIMLIGPDFGGD